jgi:hypothetical protein
MTTDDLPTIMDQVLANAKVFQSIAERRSASYAEVERALVIVQRFIRERHRVLYGGMAIDLNLKSKGHEGIYPAEAIPDYDIMSPDYYRDSVDLADLLHKAGSPNVTSISALHVTGRRVRVNFIPVCDLSYVPPAVYDAVPYVDITNLPEYRGLRVVHPDFQRIDMHHALSHPYENAPREVVLQRFGKDQKRFRLLDAMFPLGLHQASVRVKRGGEDESISESSIPYPVIGGSPVPIVTVPIVTVALTWKELDGHVISGLLAYGLLRRWAEFLGKDPLIQLPEDYNARLAKIPRWEVRFTPSGLEADFPTQGGRMRPRVQLMSKDWRASTARLNPFARHPQRYYSRYLDLRPRSVRWFMSSDMDGDTYDMSRQIREAGRSFHEMLLANSLHRQPDIRKMLGELDALPAKMTPAEIVVWIARLRDLWAAQKGEPIVNAGFYQGLLDKLQPVAVGAMPKGVPEMEILDTAGSLIPGYSLKRSWQILGHDKSQTLCKLPPDLLKKVQGWPEGAWIVQPQYLLMQMLALSYERSQWAGVYRDCYRWTSELVILMEGVAATLYPGGVPESGPGRLVYQDIPFFLTHRSYGEHNQGHSYVLSVRDRVMQVQGRPPVSGLRPPFTYAPDRGVAAAPFDIAASPLFRIEGNRVSVEDFAGHHVLNEEFMEHLSDTVVPLSQDAEEVEVVTVAAEAKVEELAAEVLDAVTEDTVNGTKGDNANDGTAKDGATKTPMKHKTKGRPSKAN